MGQTGRGGEEENRRGRNGKPEKAAKPEDQDAQTICTLHGLPLMGSPADSIPLAAWPRQSALWHRRPISRSCRMRHWALRAPAAADASA